LHGGKTLVTMGPQAEAMTATTPAARMSLAELRIELPDHPGALAAVTRELARLEMNVVEVAIHEVDGARAVDEIVVTMRRDLPTVLLRTALAAAGAELLSVRPCEVRLDPVVASLTWITEAFDRPHDLGTLARGIEVVTGIRPVQLVPAAVAGASDAGAAALRRGRPVVKRVHELPAYVTAPPGAGAHWLLVAPDGAEAEQVVVAIRPPSTRFTATEVRRLTAILDCRRTVLRSTGASRPVGAAAG
jgi:hypothetical protein